MGKSQWQGRDTAEVLTDMLTSIKDMMKKARRFEKAGGPNLHSCRGDELRAVNANQRDRTSLNSKPCSKQTAKPLR